MDNVKIVPSQNYVKTDPEEYRKQMIRMFEINKTLTVEVLAEKINRDPEWIKEILGKELVEEYAER